jgi:PAS domain S-box-containing protein
MQSQARDLADVRDRLHARREEIVSAWRTALATSVHVPLGADAHHQALGRLLDRLVDSIVDKGVAPGEAKSVGTELVGLGYTRSSALGQSLAALGRELVAGTPELQGRVSATLAELAAGFVEELSVHSAREQQAIRESEARLRAFLEATPAGITVTDMQGRIVYTNRRLQEELGYTEDELRGRATADLVDPSDNGLAYTGLAALAEGRIDQFEIEQLMHARDGRILSTHLVVALVRDAEGHPQFAVGVRHDVTESRRAEAERLQLVREQAARAEAEAARARMSFLAEASARMTSSLDYETTLREVARALVPGMADWCALNLVDAQGDLRTVASEHATGAQEQLAVQMRLVYPRSGQPYSPVLEVLRTGQAQLFVDVDASVLRSMSRDDEQLRMWQAIAPRSAIIVPLSGQRGVMGNLSLITTSASDRRYGAVDLALAEDLARRAALAVENAQLYAQAQMAIYTAEEAVRMREEFLSVAAHELRTPVTSLLGFAQLTLRALEQDEDLDRDRLHRALVVVNQQSEKLRRLVAQLLDISRIQSGRLTLELRVVDLSELLREVVRAMEQQSAYHTLHLVCPQSMLVRIDPLRFEQVLTNLLDNAIKYSPMGGPVQIDVSSPDVDHVQVAVRDHGPGIRPEYREHIFERFYQAGEDPEHVAGMGLGLFISRQIVELHGGSIGAQFPDDGGARFVVTLPALHPEHA